MRNPNKGSPLNSSIDNNFYLKRKLMIPVERCSFLLPKVRRAKSKVPTKILFVIMV